MGKEQDRKKKGSYRKRKDNTALWIFGFLAVAFIAVWGWSEWAKPSNRIPGLETFPDEGADHVAAPVTYKTDPPTSGPHYPVPASPGFYTEVQPAEALVHSLEHGNIVMYYDPEDTPAEVVEQLKAYVSQYPGDWDGVIATPREQEEDVVLTAWRQKLAMPTWDKGLAERFIDAFRGRGPENPVR